MSFLLISLIFVHCSKGSDVITPIMPDKTSISGTESDGIVHSSDESGYGVYVEPTRKAQKSCGGLHPQVIPFMPKDIFDEMEEQLDALAGEGKIPRDQMFMLSAKPESLSNPPLIRLNFVTPFEHFDPDDIRATFNDEDISKKVQYVVYYHQGRKANFIAAAYKPEMYVNPRIDHSFSFDLAYDGISALQTSLSFSVDTTDKPSILSSRFVSDEKTLELDFRKIQVTIDISNDVEIGDHLLNPEKWHLSYDDRSPIPQVIAVEKKHDIVYILEFDREFETGKTAAISFSPVEGLTTDEIRINIPDEEFHRTGGWPACVTSYCTQNYGLTLVENETKQAEDCENWHKLTVASACPPSACSPRLAKTRTIKYYQCNNNYTEQDSEICHVYHTDEMDGSTVGTCASLSYWHGANVDAIYYKIEMLAIEDPLLGYCSVDSLFEEEPLELLSDKVLPTINESATGFYYISTVTDDCEGFSAHYTLQVSANDETCIEPCNTAFVIKYFGDSDESIYSMSHYMLSCQDQEMYKFFLVDPNNFACVEYLKIIVHDRKGNWNSHKLYQMPAGTPKWEAGVRYPYLPYPWGVQLEFDEAGNDHRQYVNLNNHLSQEKDQEWCLYRTVESPNQGSLILLKVTTLPRMPRISITVEYEDPPFCDAGNMPPTNKVENYFSYTDSNNPNLSEADERKLWKSHPPYIPNCIRSLGDNWNFYVDDKNKIIQYADEYEVPENDPIRSHNPIIPCFWNCIADPPIYCQDGYCNPGSISLKTYENGKFGVYFETQGHGGDNFKFRANSTRLLWVSGQQQLQKFDCLAPTNPNVTFTNWRKIYLNYAFMQARDEYPVCDYDQDMEYEGIHVLEEKVFNEVAGAFDDAFIEIEKAFHYPNTAYHLVLPKPGLSLVGYGDTTKFRVNRPLDTIVLLGVDHLDSKCATGSVTFGCAITHWNYLPGWGSNHDAFYNYVAVGAYHDSLGLARGYRRFIEAPKGQLNDPLKAIANTATHEIGHCLIQTNNAHTKYDHGVMCTGAIYGRMRSYFHAGHIMSLRSGLNKFDTNDY